MAEAPKKPATEKKSNSTLALIGAVLVLGGLAWMGFGIVKQMNEPPKKKSRGH